MKNLLFLAILISSSFVQAALNFNPALVSGELRLQKSQSYVYITNTGSNPVSTSLSIPTNPQGVVIGLNRCQQIRAKQTCYFIVSFNSYKTSTPSFTVNLNDGSSQLATIRYNSPPAAPTIISSSSGSTSFGGAVTPEFYVKLAGLGAFSYNATSNIFYSWGMNYQSGYNIAFRALSPVPLNLNSTIGQSLKLVTAGMNHACGVGNVSNLLYCWGVNSSGQLGINPDNYASLGQALQTFITPQTVYTGGVLAGKSIKQVGIGDDFTCVIASDDKVYCWGANTYGQLGNGDVTLETKYVATPVNMSTGALAGKTAKMLNVEKLRVCIIANDDKAYCWGLGALGNGIDYNVAGSVNPVAVTMSGALVGKTVKYLSTNVNTSCLIASDDKAYCWGYNGSGQLGNGDTNDSLIPVPVDASGALAGKSIKAIFAGDVTTCALTTENRAYCWGDNWRGGLGAGLSPFVVSTPQLPTEIYMNNHLAGKTIKVLYVARGNQVSCVIASDDKAYCWGDNALGELGAGLPPASLGYSDQPYPVYMSGALAGKTLKNLHMSDQRTVCASASDNNVYCWGYGQQGQLGNGLGINSNQPVLAPTP